MLSSELANPMHRHRFWHQSHLANSDTLILNVQLKVQVEMHSIRTAHFYTYKYLNS